MSRGEYFVTRKGLTALRNRLREIKEIDRPQNVRDIEEALAHGDLSENAEYHAAKERQGFIEAEKREIEDTLSQARMIDPATLSGNRVVFGATVTLLNIDTDEEVIYQIVGVDEADTKTGSVSYVSPLARAMIGKEEGDEIVFQAPGGARTYEVVGVTFL